MRFLVDENLPPDLAEALTAAGHDAVHARTDLGLRGKPDEQIMASAVADSRVIITRDQDFGMMIATLNADGPSVLYLRRIIPRRGQDIARLILANLESMREALEAGALITLRPDRITVTLLPMDVHE